jgi:hypothetical protein
METAGACDRDNCLGFMQEKCHFSSVSDLLWYPYPMTEVITTQQEARLLGLSERRVYALTLAKILVHARDGGGREVRGRFNLVETVQGYIRYRDSFRSDDPTEVKYLEARARRMEASAAEAELRINP